MKSPIPEALLEMHYFNVLKSEYARILGTENLHIFKPSSRSEHWYGFDQSYFSSDEPTDIVTKNLKEHIHDAHGRSNLQFRAFFLQFKVVEKLVRRSTLTPEGWLPPYYRSEISLEPNKETGISQHETLLRVAAIEESMVSYVCPMIFSEDAILSDAKYEDLRFVDVRSSPSGWATNSRHYISFEDIHSEPFWCSDPQKGKSLELEDIIRNSPKFDSEEIGSFIQEVLVLLRPKREPSFQTNLLPRSLTIIATEE